MQYVVNTALLKHADAKGFKMLDFKNTVLVRMYIDVFTTIHAQLSSKGLVQFV